MSLAGFGSLPMSKRMPVIKGGVRRINGRQIELLQRIAEENGWSEDRLLTVIQQCCPDVQISEIGDCVDGPLMQEVVARLKGVNK